MQFRINIHGILLNQQAGSLEITLALDALNFSKQLAEEMAELGIIINLHISLRRNDIALTVLQNILGRSIVHIHLHQFHSTLGMLHHPPGYQRTVAHVGFLYLVAFLDADGLGEQTVHQITVILSLICLIIRSQTQFYQFMVGYIIESEKIGSCLFYRTAIRLQCIRVGTRQELSATMSQTLMQVGMQIIGNILVLIHQTDGILVDNEFIAETIALSCLVICLGQVTDGHTLRTIFLTDPVGIRKIDADGRSWILFATQHRSTDDIGCNTLHLRLAETWVYR